MLCELKLTPRKDTKSYSPCPSKAASEGTMPKMVMCLQKSASSIRSQGSVRQAQMAHTTSPGGLRLSAMNHRKLPLFPLDNVKLWRVRKCVIIAEVFPWGASLPALSETFQTFREIWRKLLLNFSFCCFFCACC